MKYKVASFVSLTVIFSIGAIETGVQAPAFDNLTDINGKTHSLSDYTGKIVVLEWTNYDCPFVKKHYGSNNMQQLQKKYTADGVIWLSINSSAAGKQGNYTPAVWRKKSAERHVGSTAILLDPNGKTGKAYGAKTTPHMFVIDQKGILQYAGAIDSIPSSDVDDLSTAKNYVAAALDAVLAGKSVPVATSKAYGCSVKY